jgi:ATP-binding cassette subfamily F protein 3
VALAQFEGTLVLVSHDRHLLRATTDQFMIVAGGRLQAFDGDLDDYKDWLLKSKSEVAEEKNQEEKKPGAKNPVAPKEKRPANRKPIEARIKRLEEQMAKLNAKKASIDAQLADPAIYQDRQKIEPLLLDQAYVARELAQLESEWLEKQDELERVAEQGS